jgi:hypothetical protein
VFRSRRLPAAGVLVVALATAFAAGIPARAQIVIKPLTPSQLVAPQILVNRIDANCAVFRNAIRTEQPTEIAAVGGAAFVRIDSRR